MLWGLRKASRKRLQVPQVGALPTTAITGHEAFSDAHHSAWMGLYGRRFDDAGCCLRRRELAQKVRAGILRRVTAQTVMEEYNAA